MGLHDKPVVFGAPYSVYVRAVRRALEEKGVAYDLVPVDIFAAGRPATDHVAGTGSARSQPLSMRAFASTKPKRSLDTSTRPSPGRSCSPTMSTIAPG